MIAGPGPRGLVAQSGQTANAPVISVEPAAPVMACL